LVNIGLLEFSSGFYRLVKLLNQFLGVVNNQSSKMSTTGYSWKSMAGGVV
jgi:hypothetical protein